jgi:uncharacterized membrane protein YqiK
MDLLHVVAIVVVVLVLLLGFVLWFSEKRRSTRGGSVGRPRK